MRILVAMAFGCAAAAWAQGGVRPEPVGSVTGHVFCQDTQRPARLAKLSLVAVPKTSVLDKAQENADAEGLGIQGGDLVESGLDGAYTLRNVKPGEYFLVVDADGYELPLAQFTAKQLARPTEEEKQRMAKVLHTVRVVADQATQEEVMLRRGAAVEGTITYDDGSPAGTLGVVLLMKSATGKWEPGIQSRYRSMFGFVRTDDYGRYRVTGLPAGEYVIETDLALNTYETTRMPTPGTPNGYEELHMQRTKFELPLFSGNVWRKPLAQAFTLGDAQQRTGLDLQFPLSKLHKVSGQVLAKDGHALNGGKLTLSYADDKSKVTDTEIETAESQFHLAFIPEGEFTLKGSELKDVTTAQVANPPGSTPKFHPETRTLRTYDGVEQPLVVVGDANDIVMTVPEAKSTK